MGCSQQPAIPADVLPKEKMPLLVAELELAETKVSRMNLQHFDSSKVAFRYLEDQILAKYKLDTAQYYKSYRFYASYPEYMFGIYEEALKLVEAKKDSMQKAENKQNMTKHP